MRESGHAEVRDLVARGELLTAYDRAAELLEHHDDDPTLRYLAALALARAGAPNQAGAELAKLDEGGASFEGLPRLEEDVAALRARLVKDTALALTGEDRRRSAAEASGLYEAVYREHGSYFACINAATMARVADETERAEVLAREARELVAAPRADDAEEDDAYWRAATRAEAALLLGERQAAAQAMADAIAASDGNPALRATTRRQLQLVCRETGLDPALVEGLPVPSVLHFTGHRFTGRDEDEDALRAAIDDKLDETGARIAFGALAYGADILVAEQVLARGDSLHVVLPCPADQFVEWSVAPGGENWIERFDTCIAEATSVWCDPSYAPAEDAVVYAFGSRLAMGHTVIAADALTSVAFQLALWDGENGESEAGTGSDVRAWQETGRVTEVIPCRHPDTAAAAKPGGGAPPMELRAMVFADFRGFSKLDERQVVAFYESVMAAMADSIDHSGDEVLFRNSWGDGLYLVYQTARGAALGSLALQEAFRSLDLPALGLPPDMGLRIGVHAGPVFAAPDPIRREPSYFGTHVTRTARIEPRTPPGEVYMTASSAALLALDPVPGMTPEYVGHFATAKEFGVFPMYVLTRR
ncbi:MAG: adenylate/guanylate cyclase domain-containing protein [Acidimicrobiia bacterium]|nr:adenylate/guanylate cyclase domain-containing protein [Acidimicrobiia bacterium]